MMDIEVDASLGLLAPVPLEPPNTPITTTIHVAKSDGDILLVLGDRETRLCVSSVILSSASPVFKTMLGPDFLEGQDDRSAQNPKRISLPDDDVNAMVRLCRLIHHQDNMPTTPHDKGSLAGGAEQLLALMVVADKYGCIDSIRFAGEYMLFSSASVSASLDPSMETLLHLVAAAYILNNSRHFALFTRKLVLDTPRSYSSVINCPALGMLPGVLLRECFPRLGDEQTVLTLSVVLLEEQRKAATNTLRFELPALAEQRCYRNGCGRTGTDLTFANALAREINSHRREMYWPPHDNYWSLRDLLKQTFHCGDVSIHLATGCRHEHDYEHKVGSETLKSLCNKISKIACGLCLNCLEDDNTDPNACTHRHLLEQWINNDPIS